MTEQEQKFADEFVFRYFNSEERNGSRLALYAASDVGYSLSKDDSTAQQQAKALYNQSEINQYIQGKIREIKEKLSPRHRRTLWTAIREVEIDVPIEWHDEGFIKSTY